MQQVELNPTITLKELIERTEAKGQLLVVESASGSPVIAKIVEGKIGLYNKTLDQVGWFKINQGLQYTSGTHIPLYALDLSPEVT